MPSSALVRWLPEHLFTHPEYRDCHLLYYTGITRTAKGILAEIVRSMFLSSSLHLGLLEEMKAHALDMAEAIQRNDFKEFRNTGRQDMDAEEGTGQWNKILLP